MKGSFKIYTKDILVLNFSLTESDWLLKVLFTLQIGKFEGYVGDLWGELCYPSAPSTLSVALFRSHKHLLEVTNPTAILTTADLKSLSQMPVRNLFCVKLKNKTKYKSS